MYLKAATDNEKIINEAIFLYNYTNLGIKDSIFAAKSKVKDIKAWQPKRHLEKPVKEYIAAFYDLDNYSLSKDLKMSIEEVELCRTYLEKNNLIRKYARKYWSD